jgi:hypothetical protein
MGWTGPRRQFRMVVPNICWSSVWNLLYVILLAYVLLGKFWDISIAKPLIASFHMPSISLSPCWTSWTYCPSLRRKRHCEITMLSIGTSSLCNVLKELTDFWKNFVWMLCHEWPPQPVTLNFMHKTVAIQTFEVGGTLVPLNLGDWNAVWQCIFIKRQHLLRLKHSEVSSVLVAWCGL